MKKIFYIIGLIIFFSALLQATPANADITTDLVGWWKFEGNANDSAGTNDGTFFGGTPSYPANPLGQAITFDGSNDYVNVGDPASGVLDFGTGDFSVSFWAKTSQVANSSQWPETLSKSDFGSPNRYGFEFFWGNPTWGAGKAVFKIQSGGTQVGAINDFYATNDNSWHHYVGLRGPNGLFFYVDGVLVGVDSTPLGSISNSSPFRIGAAGDDGWSEFGGLVDDVRIYNRALTGNDVNELYYTGSPASEPTFTPAPNSLVAWYEFNGDVSDSSVNGYDATFLGGTPTYQANPPLGQALDLNGSNDFVTRSDYGLPSGSSARTISLWVNPENSAAEGYLVNWGTNTSNQKTALFLLDGSDIARFSFWGTDVDTANPIPQNIWTHIVGTYDGGTALQLYVNGIPNNSATLAQVANTVLGGSLDIGRYTGTWGYFNGSIDDVRIYNYKLTPAEIQALCDAGPCPASTVGNIEVNATLDGQPWPSSGTSAINYTLVGSEDISNSTVPNTYSNVEADWLYTLDYVSGGPAGAYFSDITPIGSQFLPADATIGFTMNFVTSLCPLIPQAGRTIIDFSPYSTIGSPSYAPNMAGPYSASISAGTYNITLVGYDKHTGPGGTGWQNQPNEKYYLKLFNSSGGLIKNTGSSNDIANDEDYETTLVDSPVCGNGIIDIFSENIASVEAWHASSDEGSYNSLKAVCAAFDLMPSSEEECDAGPNEAVGWWKLDEISGTTASDSSVNGNGGILTSMDPSTDWVAGKIANALDFDGVDDNVSLGNSTALQITGNQTISMWLKPNSFSARRNPYAKAYGGEGTITQETNGTINYFYGTGGGNTTPYQGFTMSNPLILNEWTHVVIVRDLSNMTLRWYKNGAQTNQVAASYSSATASSLNAYIGKGYVSNYSGTIDDVRVYNRALLAPEIANIHSQGLGGQTCTSRGFSGGTLSCNAATCKFYESQCTLPPLYTLNVNPDKIIARVKQSSPVNSTQTTITVIADPGFSEDVVLTAIFPPELVGATGIFSDDTLSSSEYSTGSTFYVSLPAGVPVGSYTITVRAVDGTIPPRTVTLEITVNVNDPNFKEVLRPVLEAFANLVSPITQISSVFH